jgi:hypothetical protein
VSQTFSESWHRVAEARLGLLPTVVVHKQHSRGRDWYVLRDSYNQKFYRIGHLPPGCGHVHSRAAHDLELHFPGPHLEHLGRTVKDLPLQVGRRPAPFSESFARRHDGIPEVFPRSPAHLGQRCFAVGRDSREHLTAFRADKRTSDIHFAGFQDL